MPDSTENKNNKISVEELLRLKRAERPDEAFWEKFDGELHQRMMQTLVKKDPWPVQILRGLSGRMAQISAIVGIAAALAVMVIRPTLVTTSEGNPAGLAGNANSGQQPEAPLEREISPAIVAQADYATEVVTVGTAHFDSSITPEYKLDDIVLVNYEKDAYSADFGLPGFATTGVASIVY